MPFGMAFGVAASEAGLEVWQASAFSVLVFAGSAQFAAVDVIGDGGAAVAAVVAGLLLNMRFLAYGVVMAPALDGPWWRRALRSHWLIDETTAVGSTQEDPHWRRYGYLLTGALLFTTWNASTLFGAAVSASAGDAIVDWGIDATIPAAFLALLWPRLGATDQRVTALVGGVVALALIPIAPPGIPISAAAVAVVAGWRVGGTR